LQNFVSVNSTYSDNTRSSRDTIKAELAGKLNFGDHNVFQRLGVDRLSATFVDACAAALQQDPSVQDAKTKLGAIVANASRSSEAELEPEGDDEDIKMKPQPKPSKARERQMYNPLVRLLPLGGRACESLTTCSVLFSTS
jgi:hypothetical protein